MPLHVPEEVIKAIPDCNITVDNEQTRLLKREPKRFDVFINATLSFDGLFAQLANAPSSAGAPSAGIAAPTSAHPSLLDRLNRSEPRLDDALDEEMDDAAEAGRTQRVDTVVLKVHVDARCRCSQSLLQTDTQAIQDCSMRWVCATDSKH